MSDTKYETEVAELNSQQIELLKQHREYLHRFGAEEIVIFSTESEQKVKVKCNSESELKQVENEIQNLFAEKL